LPILRYRYLILLYTQLRDGCRHLSTIREWPAEFGPYAPGYQPRSGEHRVSTQANQEPKSSPIPKPIGGKEVMYKFNVLVIARVVVYIALQKYEIESTRNRICEKLILCLN
jgi:hypothetical protein